jgi:outer membrane protein TolC
MPLEAKIDVKGEWPKMVPVRLEGTSAVRAALANRLDLRNEKEQTEDAERAARIAKNALLPEVGLTASWSVDTEDDAEDLGNGDWDAGEYSVGLTLEVPIDKTEERNTYRSALVSLDRRKRTYALKEDRIKKEVRDALRGVRRLEATVGIQDTKRKLSERRLKNARYLFDEGSAGNRDIIEAQQDLLDAENEYVRSLASYEVARLELKRALGLLFVNRDGSWKEQ